MRFRLMMFLAATLMITSSLLLSCSGRQPKGSDKKDDQADAGEANLEESEEVKSAQTRIKDWLGKDLSKRVGDVGKDVGKKLGSQLAKDSEVMSKAKGLSKAVFEDPTVKKELKYISDKATEGVGNKLTLGWKALTAGGIDNYKKKVSADAKRVAVAALTEHIKENLLKDERMTQLLKDISPVVRMQGKIMAAHIQENLPARVTQKILAVVLKIATAGNNAETAKRVEQWIDRCDDHAGDELEKLIVKLSEMESFKKAARDLAIDVLGHQRTKTELTTMAQNLVKDPEVRKTLIKVYEAAAFDKGDAAIKNAMHQTLALPQVDAELFATMERLAKAEGASTVIGRHVATASESTKVANAIENFAMSVLEGCGDPTE